MKIQQLSVFLENRRGRLSAVCDALAGAGINISTLSLADTERFGILRLIVRDWTKAKEVLEARGCVVNVTDVMATEVVDEPGGLAAILSVIEKAGISVEYMYAFTVRTHENAVMIFRFDRMDEAMARLQASGVNAMKDVELFGRR